MHCMRRLSTSTTAFLFVLCALAAVFAACNERPAREGSGSSVVAVKCDDSPSADGMLEERCWKRAMALGPFTPPGGSGRPSQKTIARIGWDTANLYVAFECEDADIRSSYHERDAPLWREEAVEIFLDTDADGKDYVEIEVSPNRTTFDAYFAARRAGRRLDWNPRMQVGVLVRGTMNKPADHDIGWTAEIAIPFDELPGKVTRPPRAGWKVNMYRIDRLKSRTELSSLRPVPSGDFHDTSSFVPLVFAE
ncbi:MAG: hypothetical protein D6806_10580 [Deltaproteobacteria bacterium]|nr:MAG: hypothetical protein D6806_10580 [Deltaproteobacteria bacterium]